MKVFFIADLNIIVIV